MTSVLIGVMESQCFNFNVKGPSQTSASAADDDLKRRQVPRACFNCRKSKTACSFERPCHRCILHGLCDTCYDVPRKKRGFDQCPGAIVSYIPSGYATRSSTEGESGFGALFVAPTAKPQPISQAPTKDTLYSECSWGPNAQQQRQQEQQDRRASASYADFERPGGACGKRERTDEFSGPSESPSKRHCAPSPVSWRDNFPSFSSDSPENPTSFPSSSPTRPSASDEKFGLSSSSSRAENNPSSLLPLRHLYPASSSSSLPSYSPHSPASRSPPSPTESSAPRLHSQPFAPPPYPYPPQQHQHHDYQQAALDHRFSTPHAPHHHYQQQFQPPDSPPRIDPRHCQQPYPDTDQEHLYPFSGQHLHHPSHHYQPQPSAYYYSQQQQYPQNQPQHHAPSSRHPDSLKPEYPQQHSLPPSSYQETHDREFQSNHQPEHLQHPHTGQLVGRTQAQTLLHSHVLSHTSSSKYSGPCSETQWAQEEQQPHRRPFHPSSTEDQRSLPPQRESFSFEPSLSHGRSSYTLPPLQDTSSKASWSPPGRAPFSGFAPSFFPAKNPQGSSSPPSSSSPYASSSSHGVASLKANDGSFFSPITPSVHSSSSVEHQQPHFQFEQKPHPTSLPPLLLPFPKHPPY